ncbi:hypothetical protein AN640_03210 [Candidatus Epulonipiscium fishelsonii]|uniref:Uncharacterized protein n=1 Tax=Candidatus Epulonipiscium fishelsonii TaxID=77094 RepID=A0ACC8XJU1_9FIRM|nr:hypothetical protein AN640_03210 [Epulopiscium sp. SCG-D08WGA-EpuloA1]
MKVYKFKNIIMTENSFPVLFGSEIKTIEVNLKKIASDFWSMKYTKGKVKCNVLYKIFYKLIFNPVGRKLLKKKVNKNKCIGCERCAKICPVNNIKVIDGKAKIGKKCAECFGCIHWCPKQAVKINRNIKKTNQYHNKHVKFKEFNR